MAAGAVAMVALCVSAASPAAATAAGVDLTSFVVMTPELQHDIQKRVDDFRTSNDIPGLSVSVVTADSAGAGPVTTTFTAGDAREQPATPVDPSTRFEIGSVTKAYTADLLSYLLASHRVSLDDRIQSFAPSGVTVPEWVDPQTGATTQITLRDLATHQAGLVDVPPNADEPCKGAPPGCNPNPGYTQTMLWAAFDGQPLLWQPGTRFLYSNWGFSLLGTILSNVIEAVPPSQPPAFQPALDGAFIDALRMTSTSLETTLGPRLAQPHLADGTPTQYQMGTNANAPTGGLVSDARDMGTWMAANLGYLPPDAPLGVKAMADTLKPVSTITTECSSPTVCRPAENFAMGLAWQLYPGTSSHVGAPWALKNGGTDGFSSDTVLAPGLRTGVTAMFNRAGGGGADLVIPLLALLVAHQTNPSPTPAPTSPAPAPTPVASIPGQNGSRSGDAQPEELATTGLAASGPIAAGSGAAAFVIIGGLLIAGRRLRRSRSR